jgi:hypothetical protein
VLYHKPGREWVENECQGKWTFDPLKKRLNIKLELVGFEGRVTKTLRLGRGDSSFYPAKDSEDLAYRLTRLTGKFEPLGKWLIEYELEGPSSLEIEFLPDAEGRPGVGEFSAVENYKLSKRWTAEDVNGQWTYDPAKKRLALNGKYAGTGNRYSFTPYIQGWEYDHFNAKDHDGLLFTLRRVG